MKKSSSFSIFRKNEYQLRYFVLSVSEGRFRYTTDEGEAKENQFAGVHFSYADMFKVIPDFSENGKAIDFSGEKSYPFPFTLNL